MTLSAIAPLRLPLRINRAALNLVTVASVTMYDDWYGGASAFLAGASKSDEYSDATTVTCSLTIFVGESSVLMSPRTHEITVSTSLWPWAALSFVSAYCSRVVRSPIQAVSAFMELE